MCRNNKIIDWGRLMSEDKKTEARNVIKSVSDEGTGTPWNPQSFDTDFMLVNEIAQVILSISEL